MVLINPVKSNKTQRRIWSALLFGFLVMSLLAISGIPNLPQAHAASPTVVQTCAVSGTAATITCTFSKHLLPGTVIVIGQYDAVKVPTLAPGDNSSNTYTQQTQANCIAACTGFVTTIYTSLITSTGGLTITCTLPAGESSYGCTGVAVTGIGPTPAASVSSTCSAACTSPISTSSSIGTTGQFFYSVYRGNQIPSAAGASFTLLDASPQTNNGGSQFSTTVAGPTNFPFTLMANPSGFAYSGASWGTGAFNNCADAKTCQAIFTVPANSVLIVGVQCSNNCQGVAPFATSSVTDTLGNTFTLQSQISTCNVIGPCAGNTSVASGLYTSNALVSGSDTITFTYVNGQVLLGIEVFSATGVSATPSCTANGFSPAATSIQTSSLCVIPAGALAFASLTALANTLTAGASFTLTTAGVVNLGTQESTSGLVVTNFPGTISASTHVADAGLILNPTNAPTGSAVIGSCPTKNTATFTMVNSTEYLYTGSALAGESINSVSTFVSSVTSVVTAQNLIFGIYTSSGTTINALNPLVLQTQFTKSLTAGSKNAPVNWNSGFFVSVPAGSTIAIAVLGTSKINLNQSSFGGLNTGVASGGGTLAASLTTITPVATQLYFCAAASYQVSSTVTVTSTSIGFSTITQGTTTVTSTFTQTSFNQQAVVTGSVSFSILLILIMGPAILMGGVFGAIAKSGVAALGGAAIGLGLGAAIGNVSGLIPLWIVGVVVLFIIALIVLAFLANDTGGGG